MATRISCIIPDPKDPTNRILGVGGPFGWTAREDVVIGEIEDGANYYVEVGHERVAVVVAARDGRKYLTTDPGKTAKNEVLPLPNCK